MSVDDYLAALIPSPNNLAPNFMAWMAASLQPSVDTQTLFNDLTLAFDVRLAVGTQLDRLGEILNLSRRLNFQPQGGLSPMMTDDVYRLTLQAKILQNRWNGTKQQIYDFWQLFFPHYPILIQDNQDMTMSVVVFNMQPNNTGQVFFAYGEETATHKGYGEGYWSGFTGGLLQDIVRHGYFIPKPTGVSVTYTFSTSKLFSYGTESGLLAGYGEGHWTSLGS